MAQIIEQFVAYLKATSGINSLVGSGSSARIWQQDGPRESTTQASLCVILQSDESIDHLGGSSTLSRADIAVQCYAFSPTDRNALAAAVDAAMPHDGSVTAMGSLSVTEIIGVANRSDGDYVGSAGSDARLYFSNFVYRIWYYTA